MQYLISYCKETKLYQAWEMPCECGCCCKKLVFAMVDKEKLFEKLAKRMELEVE